MSKGTQLSESIEDFLEVILDLELKNKVARAKDIAEKLGIQRGSVTGALKNLEAKNLINYAPYSFITLTKEGAKIAKSITRRHEILRNFLLKILQFDEKAAEETACRMEHAIDEEGINRLVMFLEFLLNCPRTGDDWIQSFQEYCQTEKLDWEKCEHCLEGCKSRHNGTPF